MHRWIERLQEYQKGTDLTFMAKEVRRLRLASLPFNFVGHPKVR